MVVYDYRLVFVIMVLSYNFFDFLRQSIIVIVIKQKYFSHLIAAESHIIT